MSVGRKVPPQKYSSLAAVSQHPIVWHARFSTLPPAALNTLAWVSTKLQSKVKETLSPARVPSPSRESKEKKVQQLGLGTISDTISGFFRNLIHKMGCLFSKEDKQKSRAAKYEVQVSDRRGARRQRDESPLPFPPTPAPVLSEFVFFWQSVAKKRTKNSSRHIACFCNHPPPSKQTGLRAEHPSEARRPREEGGEQGRRRQGFAR
jgi:hypothetical protein